jgi:hypothetical protein
MIRRELPRTTSVDLSPEAVPHRIREDSPFRVPVRCQGGGRAGRSGWMCQRLLSHRERVVVYAHVIHFNRL